MALSLLLAAGMAASCTMYYVEEPVTNQRGAKEGADGLSLALSVTSNNMPRTKMQDDVTQSANTGSGDPTFRGLQDVHILPFRHAGAGGKESPVQGADRVNSGEIELPYTGISNTFTNANWTAAKTNGGLVANNFGHLYEHVSVPSGTASVTVYAKATEAAEPTEAAALRTHRKTYGALTDKFSTAIESAGDVTFQPVPIMESGTSTDVQNAMLACLNDIIETKYKYSGDLYYYRTGLFGGWRSAPLSDAQKTRFWNSSIDNTDLRNYYYQFINSTDGTSGNAKIIAGSSSSLLALLSNLYSELKVFNSTSNNNIRYNQNDTYRTQAYTSPFTDGFLHNKLRDAIIDKIESYVNVSGTGPYTLSFKTDSWNHYPGDGLPEGSVAIKWDGSEFIVANESSGTRLVPVEE